MRFSVYVEGLSDSGEQSVTNTNMLVLADGKTSLFEYEIQVWILEVVVSAIF
jgi:hypothetical protein